MTHEQFMRVAIAKTIEGIGQGQTPFGACVVKDDRVVSCAHNVVWGTTDPTAHAEVAAIRIACGALRSIDLSGCIIYSTCEPCPMCFAACHWARISKIVFGARIADAMSGGFSELTIANSEMKSRSGSPVEIVGDVLAAECSDLFRIWREHGQARTY